jgi:hypothetical protein
LQTWLDAAKDYAAARFIRDGALVALPEDVLPGWRELAK